MKLMKKEIDKDGRGYVTLIANDPEDIWQVYNLISPGDSVRASTIRRVQTESSTGSTDSSRVRTNITISVEAVDYDTVSSILRISGKNAEENRFVRLGAYHTLEIEMNHPFQIIKDEWDSIALDRVDEACDPTKVADVAAILMQQGLVNVCLITHSMTLVRQRIDINIPRKKKGDNTQFEKAMTKMYDLVIQAIQRHIDFNIVKVVIIASPAFIKDEFFEHMMAEATKNDIKSLLQNRKKFKLVHSSSGHKSALKEIFQDESLINSLADTKASGEVKALGDFYRMMSDEPDRAVYGIKPVKIALERNGIHSLLISDKLFRATALTTRKEHVKLVETAREQNATVHIFSSSHVTGEQLDQLTGIAAILRVPMPDLNDLDDEEDDTRIDDDMQNSDLSEEEKMGNDHYEAADKASSSHRDQDDSEPFYDL